MVPLRAECRAFQSPARSLRSGRAFRARFECTPSSAGRHPGTAGARAPACIMASHDRHHPGVPRAGRQRRARAPLAWSAPWRRWAALPGAALSGVSRLYRTRPVGPWPRPTSSTRWSACESPAGARSLTRQRRSTSSVELKRIEREHGPPGAASAGVRASSTSTCCSSATQRIHARAAGRCPQRRPAAKRRAVAGGAPPGGLATALRAGPAGGAGARPAPAGLACHGRRGARPRRRRRGGGGGHGRRRLGRDGATLDRDRLGLGARCRRLQARRSVQPDLTAGRRFVALCAKRSL